MTPEFEKAIAELTNEQIEAFYDSLPDLKPGEKLTPSVNFVIDLTSYLLAEADKRKLSLGEPSLSKVDA